MLIYTIKFAQDVKTLTRNVQIIDESKKRFSFFTLCPLAEVIMYLVIERDLNGSNLKDQCWNLSSLK